MTGSQNEVGGIPIDSVLGKLIITTVVLGSSIAMLTATVVNVALPTLARDLQASSSAQQWVVNGYLLTISSLILIGGSLGDRFGRLRIYRIGVLWFGAASLVCAVAPSIEILVGARLFQGVGGALLTPGSLAIIEATLREEDRGLGVGRWAGLIGIAGAVGPLVGGLLVDFSWRWVFLLNLPVVVAVLVLSRRLPESKDPTAKQSPLDLVGAGLTILTLGGASYTLIEGPNGTFSPLEIASALAAVAGLVGLIIYEPGRDHAMVPMDLFKNREFAVANAITLLVYGGMGIVFFLMSIQLQVTVGYSPLQAGAAFLPVTLLMLTLSARAGNLAQRVGPRLQLTLGPFAIALAMGLYSRIGPASTYLVDVLPGVILFGIGLAASVAPVTATALNSVPSSRSGAASGVNNAISRTGQLLTIAATPPLVGLTGDALGDPERLRVGYPRAMIVGAVVVGAGGLLAALTLGSKKAGSSESTQVVQLETARCCAVDGSHPHELGIRR